MELRTYQPQDLAACLRLFDSNCPDYFALNERALFEEFLKTHVSPYYVMENDGDLLGCGGFAVETEPGLVSLTWGLIRKDLQRHGLGKFLLFYRLKEIGKLADISMVRLETTQHTVAFFEKVGGFRVVRHEPGRYGEALDRVTMLKKLNVCA